MDKSNAWRSVAEDIKLSAAKEAVKAMRSLQAIIQYKAQICFVALKNYNSISKRQKELESRVQSCQEKLESCEELLRKTQSETRKSLQQISTEIQQSKPLTKREVLNLVQEIVEQPNQEAHYQMSLTNLKATTEYQEAIQATEDIEAPAVGIAKTSDYKGDDWDDDKRSEEKILVLQEQFSQNQQDFLDEYLPQWDDQLAIQKQKSEMEWENPFTAKRGEDHIVLHLSKNDEKDDDLPYPKFRKFKQLAAQIINKHKEHAFPTATDAESSTSYQPPPDAIMGPAVYPLARQNPQPTYKPKLTVFGYPSLRKRQTLKRR
ncbi:hypothetical protein Tco_0111867 [Tanacetum coccineum]